MARKEATAGSHEALRDDFFALADEVFRKLEDKEAARLSFAAETSDFVRFNQGKVRQPGRVEQRYVTLELMRGKRHASATFALPCDAEIDGARAREELEALRGQLDLLPDDPYLLVPDEVRSTEQVGEDRLPSAEDAVGAVLDAASGLDFVGIWASGGIHAGFSDSRGQRNWFSSYSFHLDFSCYRQGDKAVKGSYAGFDWEPRALREKLDDARQKLEVLGRPARTIEPGRYRVYLAPAALAEVFELLSWDAFGLKAHRSKTTPLLALVEGERRLSPRITLVENTAEGVGPGFDASGFPKPHRVTLLREGRLEGALVSPRSAKEYGVEPNGASASESPSALDLAPGDLPSDEILKRLDTGLYVGNLWYLNYSDRKSCRITGMTRFATFWVEGGEIQAPVNVMRFDESLYRMLGDNLEGLTTERELLLDGNTYGGRSTRSMRLPGALVRDFTFTL